MTSDSEYFDRLVAHTEETRALFSNPRKHEREAMVARALLRLFSVPFTEEELRAIPPEPIDVCVAGASFQIAEALDHGRRRQREIDERLKRYREAERLEKLWEPITPGVPSSITPRRISGDELLDRVRSALGAKESRYGARACADLDALIYVNLKAAVLSADFEHTLPTLSSVPCWRSISVVAGHHALVLDAHESAPEFLRTRVGRPAVVWPRPWGLWES